MTSSKNSPNRCTGADECTKTTSVCRGPTATGRRSPRCKPSGRTEGRSLYLVGSDREPALCAATSRQLPWRNRSRPTKRNSSSRLAKGNKYMRRVLNQAANATVRSKGTLQLHRMFTLNRRRGCGVKYFGLSEFAALGEFFVRDYIGLQMR